MNTPTAMLDPEPPPVTAKRLEPVACRPQSRLRPYGVESAAVRTCRAPRVHINLLNGHWSLEAGHWSVDLVRRSFPSALSASVQPAAGDDESNSAGGPPNANAPRIDYRVYHVEDLAHQKVKTG